MNTGMTMRQCWMVNPRAIRITSAWKRRAIAQVIGSTRPIRESDQPVVGDHFRLIAAIFGWLSGEALIPAVELNRHVGSRISSARRRR